MVTKTVFTASAINLFALSSVLVVGFALGKLAARRDRQQEANQQQQQEQCYPRAIRGAKRKARIRKSEDSSRAKAAGLGSPLSGEKNSTKKLSRRTRNRNKKLAPKDLALNAFTKVAQAYIPCIGAGDYESLCLLPRAAFILTGRFVPYVECCEHLVTLGLARSATAGVESLRVLYISCAWASDGEQGVWAARDFETARVFLQRNPDLSHVYVGRSCVASNPKEPLRAAQLYHIPLALLRADDILMLPPPTEDGNTDEGSSPVKQYRHSDFRSYVGSAWARMELALAAVGQANVHVTFRGDPYPESVGKLSAGKCNVDELTKQAVGCLRLAATGVDEKSGSKSAVGTITGGTYVEQNTVAVAAAVDGACDNWLGSDLNPLAVLEEIRAVVTAAEKSSDAHVLESIQGMRPTPTAEYMKDARASLGQERVEGAKELALSVLLFAVLCSQPKERATYTDGFVENAGKMEILYRPIAVVRSPYRERFGTPRQPQVTASVLHGGAQEGEIVFLKGHGYGECICLRGLPYACALLYHEFADAVVIVFLPDNRNIVVMGVWLAKIHDRQSCTPHGSHPPFSSVSRFFCLGPLLFAVKHVSPRPPFLPCMTVSTFSLRVNVNSTGP